MTKAPTSQNPQNLEQLFPILEKSKRAWEATFDSIEDPVMVVSQDYRIERANLAAAKAAGVEIQELVGKTCYQTFAKRDAPCEHCPMNPAQKPEGFARQNLEAFTDGREYVASAFSLQGQLKEETKPSVLQYHAMHAFRELQAQMLQKEKMASMGLFASGLAHDLNNPLAGILAFAQLARQGLEAGSQLADDLQEIEKGAKRCKKIIEDLMALYRPLAKEEWKQLDLAPLIQGVLPGLEVQWKDAGHQLEVQLEEPLPTVGHATKLEQVFINLIANALQALESKGKVQINGTQEGDQIIIKITDNGPGIPEEEQQRVFDPYFTTKEKKGGTGLGLPITYHIIKEHGGDIEVESEIGKGTTFKVRLPKGN